MAATIYALRPAGYAVPVGGAVESYAGGATSAWQASSDGETNLATVAGGTTYAGAGVAGYEGNITYATNSTAFRLAYQQSVYMTLGAIQWNTATQSPSRVRVGVRRSVATNGGAYGVAIWVGSNKMDLGGEAGEDQGHTITDTPFLSGWQTLDPSGNPWTNASIAALQVQVYDSGRTASLVRPFIYEVWVEVDAPPPPTIDLITVTPGNSAILSARWNNTGSAVGSTQWFKVYKTADVLVYGTKFNPSTSNVLAVWDSGAVQMNGGSANPGDIFTATTTSVLEDNVSYTVYAAGTDGVTWSSWFSAVFINNFISLPAPTISPSWNVANGYVDITTYHHLNRIVGNDSYTNTNCLLPASTEVVSGLYAKELTPLAPGAADALWAGTGNSAGKFTVGANYVISTVFRMPSVTQPRAVRLGVSWYDNTGTIIGTETFGKWIFAQQIFQPLSVATTAPAGAYTVKARVALQQAYGTSLLAASAARVDTFLDVSGGWTATTNCTLGAGVNSYSGAGRMTISSTTSGAVKASTSTFMPAFAGGTYYAEGFFGANTTAQTVTLGIEFFNSIATSLGVVTCGSASDVAGGYTKISGNAVAPANTTQMKLVISFTASGAAEVHYSDQFAVWEANLLTVDQAGVETGVTGWGTSTNCTPTRNTTTFRTGAGSLQLSSTAAGDMATASDATPVKPVIAGNSYYVEGYVRTAVTSRQTDIRIDWYNSGLTLISSSYATNNSGTFVGVADTTTGWTKISGLVTAPALAVFARFAPFVKSTGAASEVHLFDDMIFSASGATTEKVRFLTPTIVADSINSLRVNYCAQDPTEYRFLSGTGTIAAATSTVASPSGSTRGFSVTHTAANVAPQIGGNGLTGAMYGQPFAGLGVVACTPGEVVSASAILAYVAGNSTRQWQITISAYNAAMVSTGSSSGSLVTADSTMTAKSVVNGYTIPAGSAYMRVNLTSPNTFAIGDTTAFYDVTLETAATAGTGFSHLANNSLGMDMKSGSCLNAYVAPNLQAGTIGTPYSTSAFTTVTQIQHSTDGATWTDVLNDAFPSINVYSDTTTMTVAASTEALQDRQVPRAASSATVYYRARDIIYPDPTTAPTYPAALSQVFMVSKWSPVSSITVTNDGKWYLHDPSNWSNSYGVCDVAGPAIQRGRSRATETYYPIGRLQSGLNKPVIVSADWQSGVDMSLNFQTFTESDRQRMLKCLTASKTVFVLDPFGRTYEIWPKDITESIGGTSTQPFFITTLSGVEV